MPRCLESAGIWTTPMQPLNGPRKKPVPAPDQGLGSRRMGASPRLCLAPGRLESIVSATAPGSWPEPAVCSGHTVGD